MEIRQLDTSDRRQVNAFLRLPFDLYRDVPQWVPPLAPDARRMLDRRRHPFYRHSDAAFFLLYGHDRPIGRLAVLNNANHNAYNRSRTAFFYLFECINDPAAASVLFEAGFAWARDQGLDTMLGPKGLSVFDGLGLLVDGFQHRPAFGLPYNLPYYPALVEAAGFQPQNEIVSGYLRADAVFPERIHRISDAVQHRRGLKVTSFRTRRELRAIVPWLQALYNGALNAGDSNVPLTDAEVKSLANQLLWFADPRLIKIVLKDDDPVGFLFAYPDISAALQRTGGRLFPFGWFHLLRELKRTRWVNINGAGILEEYRGLGGTAILFSEMQKSIVAGGYQHADLVQVGVENDNMQRELRSLGVEFYKTHRLYWRPL